MYFLNGDRTYIKPKKACADPVEQIQDCLGQLSKIRSDRQPFKINFFVDAVSRSNYAAIKKEIESQISVLLPYPVLISVIAQPPLTSKIIVEAYFYDPSKWQASFIKGSDYGAAHFQGKGSQILIGNAQSNIHSACKLNSELAFEKLIETFNTAKFPLNSIVRQWNYVENILGFDGGAQRYQTFNDVRSGVYGSTFSTNGYPAATGIGMNLGGIIIEFLAVKSVNFKSAPIDNPEQIAAHNYSEKVLVGQECAVKSTPKFERARYLELPGKKMIFISGTASIIGERTIGIGDAATQTETTIQNIQKLYSSAVLDEIAAGILSPKYGHARVYVKNRGDFVAIRRTFRKYYGNLPAVYILADICRNDLLVEIEGKVILE